MGKPIGERIASIETNIEHLKKNSDETKDALVRLFDVSDKIRESFVALDVSDTAQDKAIADHVADSVAHHTPPCESVKTLSNRNWALLVALIGTLLTVICSFVFGC